MQHRDFKISILSTSHRSDDERIFFKEARALAAAGYSVSYVVQHARKEAIDLVQIVPLPTARSRFQRYILGPWRCFPLALRERATVYHFHDPELIPVGLLLRILGKRVVYDAHEDYQLKLISRPLPAALRPLIAGLWWCWEKAASRFFDHIIVADSHTRQKFPAHKTTVIANFPPLRFAAVSRQPRDQVFRIVYVGGISVDRGITKVIEALDLVPDNNIEFHVAGATSDPRLLRLFAEHPKVVYHGRIPWEEVNCFLAGGDLGVVLLQPIPAYTYSPGENIVKLFEYMAVGIPVLISAFPALKELVETLGCGVAVDPTDSREIAAAIDRLRQDPEGRARMGENGAQAVRDRYNWEHEEKKLLNVYAGLLHGSSP